jgi:hypothetical protein
MRFEVCCSYPPSPCAKKDRFFALIMGEYYDSENNSGLAVNARGCKLRAFLNDFEARSTPRPRP